MKTIYKVGTTILGVSGLCGALFTSEAAKADCSVTADIIATRSTGSVNTTDYCSQGNYSSWLGYQANIYSSAGCNGTDFFVESNGRDGYFTGAWVYCPNDGGWYNSQWVGPLYAQGGFSGNCVPGTSVSCPHHQAGSATEVEAYVYLW